MLSSTQRPGPGPAPARPTQWSERSAACLAVGLAAGLGLGVGGALLRSSAIEQLTVGHVLAALVGANLLALGFALRQRWKRTAAKATLDEADTLADASTAESAAQDSAPAAPQHETSELSQQPPNQSADAAVLRKPGPPKALKERSAALVLRGRNHVPALLPRSDFLAQLEHSCRAARLSGRPLTLAYLELCDGIEGLSALDELQAHSDERAARLLEQALLPGERLGALGNGRCVGLLLSDTGHDRAQERLRQLRSALRRSLGLGPGLRRAGEPRVALGWICAHGEELEQPADLHAEALAAWRRAAQLAGDAVLGGPEAGAQNSPTQRVAPAAAALRVAASAKLPNMRKPAPRTVGLEAPLAPLPRSQPVAPLQSAPTASVPERQQPAAPCAPQAARADQAPPRKLSEYEPQAALPGRPLLDALARPIGHPRDLLAANQVRRILAFREAMQLHVEAATWSQQEATQRLRHFLAQEGQDVAAIFASAGSGGMPLEHKRAQLVQAAQALLQEGSVNPLDRACAQALEKLEQMLAHGS